MHQTSNPPYRVVAIPTALAETVRRTRSSPGYGHPVHAEVAGGHGPCRHCLRAFQVGEERRLLFTLDAFAGREPFPLPGPAFIHERECPRYLEDAGFPPDLAGHRLTLAAFANGRRQVAEERVQNGAAPEAIARLFAEDGVDYIHVHDTEAGCYDLRLERSAA